MATLLIHNNALAGAMAGLMAGRNIGSFTLTDYAAIANVADAIAAEVLVRNAALAAPMADADAPSPLTLITMSAYAAVAGKSPSSVTAADYLTMANQIVAAAKQTAAKLT
jgi:hypothetical protein